MVSKNPMHVGRQLDRDTGAIMSKAVASGTFTTLGGDDTETITDTAVQTGDVVSVLVQTEGASPVTVDAAIAGDGVITVTLSADPSTDHVLQYVTLRSS